MKTWLKGGLIGLILAIILFIILIFGTFGCKWNPVEGSVVKNNFFCQNFVIPLYLIPGAILLVLELFAIPVYFLLSSLNVLGLVITIFFLFISPFLMGAIIGWIVEKIKSKNEVKNK